MSVYQGDTEAGRQGAEGPPTFRMVRRGYDPAEVDAYLPQLMARLEEAVGLYAKTEQARADLQREVTNLREGSPSFEQLGGEAAALLQEAGRSAVPVELDLELDTTRLPASIEVAAYYVVSEALTNAAKHAQASVVDVHARAGDGLLRLVVRDDGVGGATVAHGSGLIGLSDRVQALGGTITVRSPAGEGTTLEIDLPVGG
jgi:DivIVA domain-containing protein